MTPEEIEEYIEEFIARTVHEYRRECGIVETNKGGDGRFFGEVQAVAYSSQTFTRTIYLAIGKTEMGVQLVRFGASECVRPEKSDLDLLLKKNLPNTRPC